MSFTKTSDSVFGNKRILFGTASGVNYTQLEHIDYASVTPITASGDYTVTVSTSGAFTITDKVTAANYNAMVIGY